MNLKDIKEKILNFQNISSEESFFIFNLIMTGKLSEIEMAGILIALKAKTETKDEILGAAKSMRAKSLKISSNENTVDTCGTGGDMIGTLNISTSAAIVAASAGAKIAKHGNRSISSKSGSADMLEKLGYKITADLKYLELSLLNNNFCFMFAQHHHLAMKHVINVRKQLGTRTIFNLLGPLTNPANAKNQLLGVFDKKWTKIHCEVLQNLGSQHAMVVHGQDGLDEISLSGCTYIAELKEGKIKEFIFNPRDYGYEYIQNSEIQGADPEYNARKFIEMLNGLNIKFQKIVEINAGAALYLSKKSKNLKEGFELAKYVIEQKIAKNFLEKIISNNV
jgi:anthranilate phosphoribosyltransferase